MFPMAGMSQCRLAQTGSPSSLLSLESYPSVHGKLSHFFLYSPVYEAEQAGLLLSQLFTDAW